MIRAAELAELDSEQLAARLSGERRELYELRFKLAVGQLENNRQVRRVRKNIARILTVVQQRRLNGDDVLVQPLETPEAVEAEAQAAEFPAGEDEAPVPAQPAVRAGARARRVGQEDV
ncbi:MAG: 50S ribosomal protein L29 [Candidatus Dormibacteraeota bacterium]|uniref:Large ribosomal subunit protein uL29 n=1 Tax=Candidatus Dormiibacter inghamiae TaxID=3127013 RepID=A0A934NCN1_9BACT|nr:50S ribosomal protein L29 [Candidatus Dormibacteraeota bacterium]MBJ7605497.1 50S ribosomal protein L29 [Candidatus Dormibacteraeota bacterium]